MREDERDEERRVETAEPGGHGPGRHSDPHDAGDPVDEEGTDTGTAQGAPGEFDEPGAGGPNPAPRREQPGL
jgi:hypothetical protein